MAHARSCLLCGVVVACSSGRADPARPPAPAVALASRFAPEIVGRLTPGAPRPGDYALSLKLSFDTYPTMEMHVSRSRSGALRMNLAADGTVRACAGARDSETVSGQYHYEPPERRQHRSDENARLLALGGAWKVVDGVAAIQLDRLSWSTCDLAAASKLERPYATLRCVAVAATERLPEGGLACEVGEAGQLLELGMPLGRAEQKAPAEPMQTAPAGRGLVFGAPGLLLEVSQGARDRTPSFRFIRSAVTLVESDYKKRNGRLPAPP